MARSMVRAETLTFPPIVASGLSASAMTHGLIAVVFISLFMMVYVNFANRVNTVKLNQLLSKHASLLDKKDRMLLEREKLQMYHRTEKHAVQDLGFNLAKKAKVVTIIL
jgi:cell division protein FtsL